MKKLLSIVLSVVLAASCAAFTFSASAADGYVALYVKEGECELVDNSETNHMTSGNPARLMASHGIGYTSQGDSIMWSDVNIEKKATQVVLKAGYFLSKKPGTGTEFWIYLNKIEGEPIAKISVNDTETKGSDIPNQIYKIADVNIEPGTYTVFVVGETENSGSFSEVGFLYEGSTWNGSWDSVIAGSAVEEPKVEEPKVDEPVEDEPVEDEPVEDEPAEDEPAEDEPAEDEPKDEEPADAEAPAEAGSFPIVPVVIAVIVVAAIVIAIVASKKKKA